MGFIGQAVTALFLVERIETRNRGIMRLDELQLEAERLAPGDRRKLMSFLVALDVRTDEQYGGELTRRLDDRSPERWISLQDAEGRLKVDGV